MVAKGHGIRTEPQITLRETIPRKAGTKQGREHARNLMTLHLIRSAENTNYIASQLLDWMQEEGIVTAQVSTK